MFLKTTIVLLALCAASTAQVCNYNALGDIMFVVDASTSVGEANFRLAMSFVRSLIPEFVMGPNAVKIGVAAYNKGMQVISALNGNSTDLEAWIDNANYANESASDLHTALKLMEKSMFLPSRGGRQAAPNFVVVITDGGQDPTLTATAAQALSNLSYTLLLITIGENIPVDEILQITSIGKVYKPPDYTRLNVDRQKLAFSICNDIKPVDGQWNIWRGWSTCDAPCGKVYQKRTRLCNIPAPARGGKDCLGKSSETRLCTLPPCPIVVPDVITCSVVEEMSIISEIKSVTLRCATSEIYPEGECSFYRRTDGGKPVPIPKTYYTSDHILSPNKTTFATRCGLPVRLYELGEGTHFFDLYLYPNVTDGEKLVNATQPENNVTLALPRASHSCPDNLLEDYLCGKPTMCNCTLESAGRPKGSAVWLKDGKLPIQGPLKVQYDKEDPEQMFQCVGSSKLGQALGSKLKLETDIKCD